MEVRYRKYGRLWKRLVIQFTQILSLRIADERSAQKEDVNIFTCTENGTRGSEKTIYSFSHKYKSNRMFRKKFIENKINKIPPTF